MERKVIKTGNSLALTIPSNFVKDLGIKIGDDAKFFLNAEKNMMKVVFTRKPRQISLFDKKKQEKE